MEPIKEFRVRPVTRYIVTYYVKTDAVTINGVIAEFDAEHNARLVCNALQLTASVSALTPRDPEPASP